MFYHKEKNVVPELHKPFILKTTLFSHTDTLYGPGASVLIVSHIAKDYFMYYFEFLRQVLAI